MRFQASAYSLLALLAAGPLVADVSLVEHRSLRPAKDSQKSLDKKGPGRTGLDKTGEQALIDSSGFEYFINTDITFSTTSSASGAASEASYSGPVTATTSGGGTVSTTLNDAFDGYNSLCINTVGATGPCTTSSGPKGPKGANPYTVYNQNGPATLDASCSNRQVILPVQTVGSLTVQRKVFVPANDEFARWANIVTNTGATSQTVTLVTANNLGSDSGTVVFGSSDGDSTAETTDSWVGTFQNFSGTTTSDPRLGHVLQQPGSDVQAAAVVFNDGDDNPHWAYTFTLAPGQTRIILNFVTGQPSRAEAAAKAAELVGFPAAAQQCLTTTELQQTANFRAQGSIQEVPTLGEWGLVALATGLGAGAFRTLRRRRAAASR